MSDIDAIKNRIAKIREELAQDPNRIAEINAAAERDQAFVRGAFQAMRESRNVTPIGKGRRIRRPDDGEVTDL